MKRLETKRLLIDLFREETLLLTGLFAVYDVPSDFISKIMKNLSLLLERELRKLDQRDNTTADIPTPRRYGSPHPAIAEFLADLERQHDELSAGLKESDSAEEAQPIGRA